MALALLITFSLALAGVCLVYLYVRSVHGAKSNEDLAQLVQGRRPPVGESIERWSRKNK